MKHRTALNKKDVVFIESLYREHCLLMFSVAERFGFGIHDQEDVVSTALSSLMNHVDRLREISAEERKYYIRRAVISTSINHLKQQAAQQKRIVGDLSTIEHLADDTDIEEEVMLRIELANVLNSIMTLPEKESRCVRLKYLSGYTNAEIAGVTGLSESSVNQYIKRARKRIRFMTDDENGEM